MPLMKANVKSYGITLLCDLKRPDRLGCVACIKKEAPLLNLGSENDISWAILQESFGFRVCWPWPFCIEKGRPIIRNIKECKQQDHPWTAWTLFCSNCFGPAILSFSLLNKDGYFFRNFSVPVLHLECSSIHFGVSTTNAKLLHGLYI